MRKLIYLLAALAVVQSTESVHAQQGLIRARQIVAYGDSSPSGAAVDILVLDPNNSNTIVVQAGVNVGGQGNIVVNSDAGPGFDSVSIIGQEAETMIQVSESSAGDARLSLGIEATDSGLIQIHTSTGLSGDIGSNAADEGEIRLYDPLGNLQVRLTGGLGTQVSQLALGNSEDADGIITLLNADTVNLATIRADSLTGSSSDIILGPGTSSVVAPSGDGLTPLGSPGREWLRVNTRDVQLHNGTNSNTVTISPGTPSSTYTLTAPPDAGTTGYVLVNTDGAGTTAWQASGAAGGVAGVNTDVQLNLSGVHGVLTAPNRIFANTGNEAGLFVQTQYDAASATAFLSMSSYSGSNVSGGGSFRGTGARGTIASPSATQTNDTLFSLLGGGYGTSTVLDAKARITMTAAAAWTNSSSPTQINVFTTPTSSTTAVVRAFWGQQGTLFPGADSTYNQGGNNFRWATIYADSVDSEEFKVQNAGHTASHDFTTTASGLQFDNTSGNPMILWVAAGDSVFYDAMNLIPEDDATGSLGLLSKRWNVLEVVNIRGSNIEGRNPAGDVTFHLAGTGIDGGAADQGALSIYNETGDARVTANVGADDNGYVFTWTDDDDTATEMSGSGGMGQADSGYMAIWDSSDRKKMEWGVNSSGDPQLIFRESGSGSSVEIDIAARAANDIGDSIVVRDGGGVTMVTTGVASSEGRSSYFDSGGTARAFIGSLTGYGFFSANKANGDHIAVSANTPSIVVNSNQVLTARQTGPAAISCTPDATWSANEVTCLNDILSRLATWRTALGTSGHGLVTSP